MPNICLRTIHSKMHSYARIGILSRDAWTRKGEGEQDLTFEVYQRWWPDNFRQEAANNTKRISCNNTKRIRVLQLWVKASLSTNACKIEKFISHTLRALFM